jgi:uncharacterized damage-inducible protein DinB
VLEHYLTELELAYFELGEAFTGLADENVWKRPANGILSVGELAGHIAYGEANRLAGNGVLTSPLIDPRFRYYDVSVSTTPSDEQLAMTAADVHSELVRVHEAAVAQLKERNVDLSGPPPENSPGNTFGEMFQYMIFHVAYHVGQIYTVRHLLGEETPDN